MKRRSSLAHIAQALILTALPAFLISSLGAAATQSSVPSRLEREVAFDIAPQSLDTALLEFSRQSSVQVMLVGGAGLSERQAPAVKGRITVREALASLLQYSGLEYKAIDEGTVTIKPIRMVAVSPPEAMAIRVAQAEAQPTAPAVEETSAEGSLDVLEEIVVTAQKRQERLQEVPVPVTAIRAQELADTSQTRIQDYYTRIPGLSVQPGDVHGAPILAIRGVTTGGFSNPTVGITVDDVPTGSSTNIGGGYEAPDIDPSELRQVEVLRGPQGTLYGASSIGGLLKFVTLDPSTAEMSARVQGGLNSVHNGDELGYTVRGAVNIPVAETLAVRASGFTRREPGFVDSPVLGIDGVNQTQVDGGRVAALWKPLQNFSVKLNAMVQDSQAEGSADVYRGVGLGDLEQNALLDSGRFEKQVQNYSAIMTLDLGRAELVSLTGYNLTDIDDTFDYTPFLSGFSEDTFFEPGTLSNGFYRVKKISQELRLSMPLASRVNWMLGGFYTREKSDLGSDVNAVDPAGTPVGLVFLSDIRTRFKEYAAFTHLNFAITEKFDVQVGGRTSTNDQSYTETDIGALVGGGPVITPLVETDDSSFTYLATARYRPSADLMMYARVSSGYRVGGPNPNSAANPALPRAFKPDKTRNYEVGVKGTVLDRALTYDASVYYIDWQDIQLQLLNGFFLYYDNASAASSRGIELSLESRPWAGGVISAWGSWGEAQLDESFPNNAPVSAVKGDRLPFSTRVSGNVALDQDFPLTSAITAFAGASLSYVDSRKGNFIGSPDREIFGDYVKLDLRAGARKDGWTANVFVNNLTDRRAALSGGAGTLNPIAFKYIQPRTLGIAVAKNF